MGLSTCIESGMYGSNGSEWRNYDWSKITAIAPFVHMDRGIFRHVSCAANGVCMLSWDGGKGEIFASCSPRWRLPSITVLPMSLADDPRMYDREEVKVGQSTTPHCREWI